MIHIIGKIPHRVTVACSGGLDSVAILHFLMQSKRKIDVLYFNHDTIHSKEAEKFIRKYCAKNDLILNVGRVKGIKGKRSLEEFWRDERYNYFKSIRSNFIITCHHLDDVLETWLMSSFHGNPKLIPYKREPNIYRPFLKTEKKTLKDYCTRHKLDWVEDPSNKNCVFSRNRTRNNIVPEVLKINPGVRKVIRKKLIEIYN